MDDPNFKPLAQCRVAIVGLGLMGGSLAMALRGRCAELGGVEVDARAAQQALETGVIQRAIDWDDARDCDLLILAAPIRIILAQLESLAHAPTTRPIVLLDLGSTKTDIVAAMEKLPPVFDPLGGHPMCGKEVSGLAHATADLFAEKMFVLTPLARTTPRALALAHELITTIGARPLLLTPEQNDALAAVVSHVPYLAAIALVQAAQAEYDDAVWRMAASGFRDTTRLAASDLTMMTDILLTNRAAVLAALERYSAEVQSLATLIATADAETLRAALAPAQAQRAQLFTQASHA